MKESIGLVVFKGADDVPKFADDFGFVIKSNGYLEKDNKSIPCNCCGKNLKTQILGSILPGSDIFYCDNPACLSEYVSEYLE